MGKRSNHKSKEARAQKHAQAREPIDVLTEQALHKRLERALHDAKANGEEEQFVADLRNIYWNSETLDPLDIISLGEADTPLKRNMGELSFLVGEFREAMEGAGIRLFPTNTK